MFDSEVSMVGLLGVLFIKYSATWTNVNVST